jgi:tetratricopeptide (TPR) repeat protein
MEMAAAGPELDAEELLRFALESTDDHETAIGYLKRALAIAPDDGRLHYLLGAAHAGLGLHERAIGELTHAISLAPHLFAAHFQLGLLHLTRNDLDSALRAWRPLDQLDPAEPLALFRSGLVHMATGDFDECIEDLRQGIAASPEGDSLARSMQGAVMEAEAAIAQGQGSPRVRIPVAPRTAPAGVTAKAAEPQHVLLNAYKQRQDKPE